MPQPTRLVIFSPQFPMCILLLSGKHSYGKWPTIDDLHKLGWFSIAMLDYRRFPGSPTNSETTNTRFQKPRHPLWPIRCFVNSTKLEMIAAERDKEWIQRWQGRWARLGFLFRLFGFRRILGFGQILFGFRSRPVGFRKTLGLRITPFWFPNNPWFPHHSK